MTMSLRAPPNAGELYVVDDAHNTGTKVEVIEILDGRNVLVRHPTLGERRMHIDVLLTVDEWYLRQLGATGTDGTLPRTR
jgi:hypothetical protein